MKNIFYICRSPPGQRHIDESVFASSLLRNLENFIASRREQSIHHLVWLFGASCIGNHTGVGYCLFDARSSRTSKQINGKCSTLFYHELRTENHPEFEKMGNVDNNSFSKIEFEAINDSYFKGVIDTLYGLYSIDKKEILPPQYTSLELIHQDDQFIIFHVVDTKDHSFLFVDKPRTLLLIGEYYPDYSIKLEYRPSYHWSETQFTIKESIGGSLYYGALLVTDDSVFLQVPAHYDKLIYGHFYIAAFQWMYDSYNVFIYTYYNEDTIEESPINKPLYIPSEIKPEFEAIHNIAVGFNEPYPIINGKIYLLGDELYDSALPVETKHYCIVLKNGKYGLWQERWGDSARLVVDCEYDSILPYKASCPGSSDHSTLDAFSLERDGMWGVYYRGVFIPEVFEDKLEVVSSYFLDLQDFQWISSPIGFICSRRKRFGVINWSGKVIIPFRYERIDSVGYMEDQSSHLFYKAFIDGECYLFDKCGKDILGAKFSSIDFFQCYITVLNRPSESFCFFICKKDGFFGLLDKFGNVLLPFEYEEMRYNKDRRTIFVKKQKDSAYEEIKPDMSFVY